jgi:hypothetical protein
MTKVSTSYMESMKDITNLAKNVVTKEDLRNFVENKVFKVLINKRTQFFHILCQMKYPFVEIMLLRLKCD